MKVVVIGGTGLIGSKLVQQLGEHGHEAIAASPRLGINTLTGEGLAEALTGASVVVDVSNSPSFADADVMEFFTTSTRNLLAAEQAAGVGHHLAMSIVGADTLPDSGYLRAKVAQEQMIEASGIPYTIVRSTQFFEFGKSIADAATEGTTVRMPPVGFQPIASDDVVHLVGASTVAPPVNGIVEIGGPELFRFDLFIENALKAKNDPREVVIDPHAKYFGTELTDGSLVPGAGARLGEITFARWLAAAMVAQ